MSKQNGRFLHREMTNAEKIVGTIIVLLFSVFLYLSTPLARINKIIVYVGDDVSKEQILKSAKLVSNELFFMPVFFSNELTNSVKKQFPKIDTIHYSIDGNNNVSLSVTEYDVVATVLQNNKGYVILSNGALLENYYDKYVGSVTDISWEDTYDNLKLFAMEFSKVNLNLQKKVLSITKQNDHQLTATMFIKDGNKIIVNATEFATKINYYDQLTKETNKNGVFDLTVGIFFTPYQ